jgi:hypothetical protein
VFEPQRTTRRFCSTTCRKRAQRERRRAAERAAAEAAEAEAAATAAESDEIGPPVVKLVDALQRKLSVAGEHVVDSFEGQLALQLASKIANPGESGVATLAKVLLQVVDAAMTTRPEDSGMSAAADPAPVEPEVDDGAHAEGDEVERMRDAKLRAAAAGQEADRA